MKALKSDGQLHHGIYFPLLDAPHAVECAVAAEDAGWDGIFMQDHLVDWQAEAPEEHRAVADPWTTLPAVAALTDHVTLGSWITPVARRLPWQLARDVATLDRISEGRVVLGAGLGTKPDYTTWGKQFDAPSIAAKYDEALDVITGLWTGEPFSHDGEHFTVDEAVLRPTPVQEPRVPILIGGWWPHKKPIQRGARWDGIVPNWPSMGKHVPEEELADTPPHIRAAVGEHESHEADLTALLEYYRDRADEPGTVMLPLPVNVAEDPAEFIQLCHDLDVDWLLSSPVDADAPPEKNLAAIREGPPT